MPISADISDLWWLKPQPTQSDPEVGAAYRAAMQMHSQNQYLKQMQAEKIQQAMQLQRDKALSDAVRSRGMAELTAHVSEVARTGTWDAPEAEAKFWDIASRYPQAIEKNDLDAIYRNTFLEAKRRKQQADRVALPTAVAKNMRLAEQYDAQAAEANARGDDEQAMEAESKAAQVRSASNLTDPNAPLKVETQSVAGHDFYFLRDRHGTAHQLKLPDESKIPADEMVMYRAEMKEIEKQIDYGVFEDKKDKSKTDWDAVQKAMDEVYQKHHRVSGGGAPKVANPNDPLGLFNK